MKENRLDGVLTRNRKQLRLDLVLAAFFLMALVLSGLTFGNELPKLSMAPRKAVQSEMARTADEADGAEVALAPEAEIAPQLAHR